MGTSKKSEFAQMQGAGKILPQPSSWVEPSGHGKYATQQYETKS